jgi:uncharacterized protein (DUF2384 family)
MARTNHAGTGRSAPLRIRKKNYAAVYEAAPAERVRIIKEGVPALFAAGMAKSMGVSKQALFRALGLSRATIDRKIKKGVALSTDEGERVLGLAKLVGLVETIVRESGAPNNFNAAQWIGQWIEQRNSCARWAEAIGISRYR